MKKIVMTLLAMLALNALPVRAADDARPAQGVDNVELEMVRIPAGSFIMGCQDGRDRECLNREKPSHKVSIKAFEIGKYEVTQGQWKVVMGENPSEFKDCGTTCPVENVSWNDIQIFIQKLNNLKGMTYRLPTESEWEYACRAAEDGQYCGGNNLNTVAWVDDNSGVKTHQVGGKQSNAFGLYDMSGNVQEWVRDSYHNSYNGAPTDGGAWESVAGNRVVRGGSLISSPQVARAANYGSLAPEWRSPSNGFRLARTLP